jgi:hypothetical protein
LLGRYLEANNRTVAIAAQQHSKHASTKELLFGKHVPVVMLTHAMRKTVVVYPVCTRELQKKRIGATSQLSSAREPEDRWCYS